MENCVSIVAEVPTLFPIATEELYAEVAVAAAVHQTYTYRIPPGLHHLAQRGCRVAIPFGKSVQVGYVVALHDAPDASVPVERIKDIEEWLDETPLLTEEILDLTHWVADYYYAPWGEVLKSAIPSGLQAVPHVRITITAHGRHELEEAQAAQRHHLTKWKFLTWLTEVGGTALIENAPSDYSQNRVKALVRELEKAGFLQVQQALGKRRVQAKRQTMVQLPPAIPAELELSEPAKPQKRTEAQERVLATLNEAGEPLLLPALTEKAGVSPAIVRTMAQKGMVELVIREVRRDPLALLKALPRHDGFELNEGQTTAVAAILEASQHHEYACFLLQGVTGSGKTEVYLAAMQAMLEQGKSSLMLVPEIGLTPMFARRLAERFGSLVAILHSSLSEGERLDEWERIREGEARIVIGTRSAIYAPLVELGLIVVDEEHDTSYKQAETPRYHGRDTAVLRAHRKGCVVVLGSATPAIESAYHASTGKYRKLELNQRFANRALPTVDVVDMREVFKRHGKQVVFSDELLLALKETQAKGEQSMVLLNRRGFSSFLLCRRCGESIPCPDCDVTLTYHKADQRLVCHYCNHQAPVPKQCPNCNGLFIYFVGEGTEQLEELLQAQFPDFRIGRLDRDTTRRRGVFERTMGEFASGSLDVLVGTQMIAKGHDFPNVTLVGVVSVDAGLALPDFRSGERTFQLLAQVSGRAGRGELPGRVVLQTYHPEHYALQCARTQDYTQFYNREINFRKQLWYPPFSVLTNIIVRHKDATQGSTLADKFGKFLRAAAQGDNTVRILGPSEAPLSKLKQEYRYQILIKARQRRKLRDVLDLAFTYLADDAAAKTGKALTPENNPDRYHIMVEVDPVDLL